MVEYAWADNSTPFVIQWGGYGLQTNGKFAFPQGIATDQSGNVYVTDLGNRRVQEFDNNGNFLSTWGIKGSGNGTFQEPEGIAVGGGFVYVVDNDLGLVQKFDTSGHFIMQWGGKGSGNGQFLLPQGIAVDSNGDVYVVDTGNSRVEKFDGNGTFLLSIGSSGLDNGDFLSPHGVAIDSFGYVYVTDTGNNRVEKFDQGGTYLQSYGTTESLKSPIGIAVDKSGNIYVADDGNNRIVELESNGNVDTWGNSGTGADFFMEPRDVAVDSAGNIFVVDSDNNRIQKFGSSTPPPQIPTQPQTVANQTTQTENNQTTQNQNTVQNTAQNTTSSLITDPNEKTDPQITVPSDMTVEATGVLTSVSIGQATATDAVKVVSITNNAPSKFPLGTTMITWTAMNAGGNTAVAVQKITIVDTTPPTLTAPPNVTVQATSANHTTVSLGLPSSYDAVGVESITNDAPPYFPLGQTTVTWKAIDPSGNVATAKQVVTVQDTTPPTIRAPADMTVNATGTLTPVNIGQATTTDNIGISSLTNNAPQQGFQLGTTLVTWTATDAGGNTANTTQKITVVNHTPPILTVPSNVTFQATSLNNNTVPLGNATSTDFESVTIANNAPKVFSLGKTVVLWTATDKSGNTSNATQTVNVIDSVAPKLTPPSDVTFQATSLNNNTVPLGNATATDIEPVTITNNASKVFSLGKSIVLWTAKDDVGNISNATQIINVVDTTAPKITAPSNVTFEATSLANNTVPLGAPTVTDIGQVTVTNDAPKTFSIGLTTVTWTAKDTSGNTANATQTVNIVHTTPPKLTPPSNVTFEATSVTANTVPLGNATATDIEPVTITNNASSTFPLGKSIVLWTAKDATSIISNVTQTVNVIDSVPPKLTPPSNVTFEATSVTANTVPLGNATATDIEPVTITNNASSTFPLGKSIVLWTAKDTSGNTANATQTVNIVHTTPPKLTPPSNVTFEATSLDNNTVPLGSPIVTDIEQVTVTNNAPKAFSIGLTTVTWTTTDTSGNTANVTQTVLVKDTTPPKLTPPSNVTFEATAASANTVPLGNATATDIEPVTITNNASKVFSLGKSIVLWTAKDAVGNISNITQIINVVDTTPPKITAPSNITVDATSLNNNTATLGDATATDNVKVVSVTNNASKTFPLGKTTVLWIATDEAGNTANATQIVNVVNTAPPKLTPPSNVTFQATSLNNNTVPLGNATATDIEPVTITNNASKVFSLGKSIVLWTAKDKSGNVSNVTQVIDVIDTSPPKITAPHTVIVNATSPTSNNVSMGNATATDNTEVVSITNDAPAIFPFGNTTVTWVAKDESGNMATATQLVEVVDHSAPQLTVPSNIVTNATAFETPVSIGQASATGIIDTSPKITNNATGLFHIGTTTIQWTAVDKFGNTKTLDQTVDVLACGKPESLYNVIMGTNGNDTLTGSSVQNLILGLDGNDIIHAGPAGDCIIAGNGNSVIFGGSGNDMIIAGNGDNIIRGSTGNELVYVGTGSNIIQGGTGHNTCYLGNPGADTVVNCQALKQ
ncbi:MAG: HYR domain-containing protein [Nitrosotalea sp.]